MDAFFQTAGIPVLTALACFYFAIRLIVFKDTDSIRGNMDRKLKDKDAYAKYAGALLLLFGVCSCIMAALLFVNTHAAIIEISLSLMVVLGLWSFVEKKYGGV